MNMELVKELADSFVDGNRKYVIGELMDMDKRECMAYTAYVLDYLMYSGEVGTFLRMLEDRLP